VGGEQVRVGCQGGIGQSAFGKAAGEEARRFREGGRQRGTRTESTQRVQPVGQFATEVLEGFGASGDFRYSGGAGLHGRLIAAGQPGLDDVFSARG